MVAGEVHSARAAGATGAAARAPVQSEAVSRLAALAMTYAASAILIATLAPFEFAWPERFAFNLQWRDPDLALNLLLMMPIGMLLRLSSGGRLRSCLDALALGAAFSTLIELLQMFEPARCASPFDMAANATGAGLGAWLDQQLAPWLDRQLRSRLRARPPLADLPYLLLPLLWLHALAVDESGRALLALPLGIAGACVVLGRVPVPASARSGRAELWPIARTSAWFLLGSLPAVPHAPGWVATNLLCVAATAYLLTRGALAAPRSSAVLLCGPLLLSYLLGVALWPLQLGSSFRFTAGFIPFDGSSRQMLLGFLEYTAAAFVLGYLLAERAASLRAVVLQAALGALLLELLRGFSACHRASLVAFALVIIAALAGATLQRARYAVQAAPAGTPRLWFTLGLQRART